MSRQSAVVTEAVLDAWGRSIGASVAAPAFFAIRGPLGAGKSVLARAIARGAGVRGTVPSPTYTLVQVYEPAPGRRIVHMDLYRLSTGDEVFELGWDDWVGDPDGVLLVEWADRAGAHLPRDRWDVSLAPVDGDPHARLMEVTSVGRPRELPPLRLHPELR